jgi:hypothetical protein
MTTTIDSTATLSAASSPTVALNALAPAAHAFEPVVEQWFRDTFHNLPIDPELYNRFHAAKEALKARLHAALTT